MTKDTTPPWRVNFPEEDKLTRHLKSSLIAACYGNERIADVLDQLTCMASYEAKNKGYPESQKIVRIKRTNQEILERLQYPTSFRSLNTYLHQLNEWGYVLSQPYQRNFDVNFETIQSAIDNPPAQPEKISSNGLHEKSGKSANLQPFEEEEKGGKVAMLQKKVANLLKKVEDLSTKVEDLSTFQTRFNALEKLVQDHFFGATNITDITTDTTVNNVVAASNNALTFTLLTDEDFQDIEKQLAKQTPGLQALKQIEAMRNTPPSDNLTLAGNSTTADGGNHSDATDTMASDHNAIPEPVVSPTMPLTQESAIIPQSEIATPEIALQPQESTSSTQAVKGLSNQATEQGKQANGVDPIATGATKKARGGRGKNAAGEEKPAKPKKEITGSREALAIVDLYISLFTHPIPLTQSMVDEAEKLVPCHPTREDINGCRLWCYASNPDWYGKNGKTKGRVTMRDIVNNWAGWVASQEAPATGFQMPDELKDRVAGVYAALNEWRAGKTGDAENVFVPDVESDQAICNLLQKGRRPTKKRMNAVCDAIWETPRNVKTGYLLREHITVKMICQTYRERELDLAAKEQEDQGPKNVVDLFDTNRTFGNGLKYLPGALPVAKSAVMEG